MRCDVCGKTVTPDTPQCPTCGAPLTSSQTTVNHLLTEAYRLFLQHRLEEALIRCTEVMRRDPQNPSVPSLLGDIYSERGELEEALRWYRIAVDLNPHKTEELKKIEKIQQKLRQAPSSSPLPYYASLGVSFLGGLLISGLLFFSLFNPSGKGQPLPSRNGDNQPTTPSSPRARSIPGDISEDSSGLAPFPSTPPQIVPLHPSPPNLQEETSRSLPESSSTPSYRTPPETALKSEMEAGVPRERPGLVLIDVLFDTRGPKAVILLYRHLSTLSPHPWSVLLTDLYSTASWALTRDRSLRGITVKVLTWVNRPPSPHFEEILICDIDRQRFLSTVPYPLPLQSVPPYCENLWWNPLILPAPPRFQ